MLSKKCDRCRERSFGSDAMGRWICPYCGKDISHNKVESATHPTKKAPTPTKKAPTGIRIIKQLWNENSA